MWKYSKKVILQVPHVIIFVKFFHFHLLKWIHRANILELWEVLPLPLVEMDPQSQYCGALGSSSTSTSWNGSTEPIFWSFVKFFHFH
jgi:hypothetical protein